MRAAKSVEKWSGATSACQNQAGSLPDNRHMMRELAHRPRGTCDATTVAIEASGSAEAIAQLRSAIPSDHLVLYVRMAE